MFLCNSAAIYLYIGTNNEPYIVYLRVKCGAAVGEIPPLTTPHVDMIEGVRDFGLYGKYDEG